MWQRLNVWVSWVLAGTLGLSVFLQLFPLVALPLAVVIPTWAWWTGRLLPTATADGRESRSRWGHRLLAIANAAVIAGLFLPFIAGALSNNRGLFAFSIVGAFSLFLAVPLWIAGLWSVYSAADRAVAGTSRAAPDGTHVQAGVSLKNIAMSMGEQEDLLDDICNDVLGYGPLEPLLARDDIADIMVNGAGTVYIEVAGKIQRTGLHEKLAHALAPIFVEPRTQTERTVESVFREVLRSGPLGAHANFFAAGGDSLRGSQVIGRINERLSLGLSVTAVFQYPTVAELARAIDQASGASSSLSASLQAQIDALSDEEVARLLAELDAGEAGPAQ